MANKFDVLCIGKTTVDQFLMLNPHTIKFHLDPRTGFLSFKHGEKIDVEKFDFCLGGNATNVAIGLSRLGLSAALCSEVGDDEFSVKINNELEKEKIDRSYMVFTKNTQSSFSVIINYRGERTIFMQRMERAHKFNFENISTNYIFLTSLEKEWQEPYMQVISYLVKNGCKLVFNPGTLQLHEGKELVLRVLKHTDILFVNKEEAEELVLGHERRKRDNDRKYIRELLSQLQKKGPKTVVVTNGRYGSHSIDENGNFFYEGLYSAEVVERTGAGDAYTTAFLAAMIYQKSIKEAMKWGAINSSSVVNKVGAVAGLMTKESMEKVAGIAEPVSIPQKPRTYSLLNYISEKLKFRN